MRLLFFADEGPNAHSSQRSLKPTFTQARVHLNEGSLKPCQRECLGEARRKSLASEHKWWNGRRN